VDVRFLFENYRLDADRRESKPQARDKIPAVVHPDGTGRIQIVRAEDDPLTYA
jgi:predicted NodU family carbamoyl transferase